jgi:hypothetical protein
MMFNDVDKSKPHTVLMVAEPVRLACLSFAGLARGVYYIQGDFRSKITKMHDRRLVEAKLIALRFVSDTEKPDDFVKTEEIRAAAAEELPPSSGVDASPPVEMVPIIQEPQTVSKVHVVKAVKTEVDYDPQVVQEWTHGTPQANVVHSYARTSTQLPVEVAPLPVPTEMAPTPTETPAVPTEQAPVVTDPQPVGESPFVAQSEPPLVCTTEVAPSDPLNPPLSDTEPIVLLEQPKKRRGRKPKQVNAIAQPEGAAKLTEHEEDRRSADPPPAAPAAAEDSLPDESSKALA